MGLFDRLTESPDERYMRMALKLAQKAYERDDVPIGCVIVKDGRVIAKGYNKRTADANVLSHAELIAIKEACRKVRDWRLEECTLYVTLEPCQMCAGAIVQARIPKVVIGAMNPKAGSCGSVINLLDNPQFNHQAEIVTGVLGDECSLIIKDFFADLRDMQKARENFNENRAEGMPTDSYKPERVETEVEVEEKEREYETDETYTDEISDGTELSESFRATKNEAPDNSENTKLPRPSGRYLPW